MKRTRTQNAQDIADLLSIEPQTVNRWAVQGCPHEDRDKRHYFDAGEVAAWMKETHRTCRRGRPAIPKDPALLALRIRKEQAIVEMLEAENARENAKYIDATEAKKRAAAIVATVRKTAKEFFDGIGEKCAGKDAMEIQTILDDAARGCLVALSEGPPLVSVDDPEPAATTGANHAR